MSILRPLVNALTTLAGQRAAQGAQAAGGIEGELLISEARGKYGARAKSGKLFIASTALAGVTIPVNANNLVSVFTLENPLSSGVDLELEKLRVGIAGTTTAVIGDLAWVFQNNNYTALASLTRGTVQNAYIGGPGTKANFFTAATFAGTPAVLDIAGISFGTTGATPGPMQVSVEIDGSIIVPPGAVISLVGNVAQTQPFDVSLIYMETPV